MKDINVIKITNKKKSINAIACESYWSRTKGLMFSKKKSLIFIFKKPSKLSWHMFFVFFSIDIYFLDKNKKIIEMKKDFKPFNTYYPKNEFNYALETPKGVFSAKIGDQLAFENYINP